MGGTRWPTDVGPRLILDRQSVLKLIPNLFGTDSKLTLPELQNKSNQILFKNNSNNYWEIIDRDMRSRDRRSMKFY